MLLLKARGDHIGYRAREADQVCRDDYDTASFRIFNRERFGSERRNDACGRMISIAVAGKPDASLRRDVDSRNAGPECSPVRGPARKRGEQHTSQERANENQISTFSRATPALHRSHSLASR
jgi:hypothetical protein